MELTEITRNFVTHWGEMGTKWGINRTVAQIHALLSISPEPLNAEEITKHLQIARSNVSASLKELETWGLIRVLHVIGDRREQYECVKDVWQMFQIILEERKKREIDPTLEILRRCVSQVNQSKEESPYTKERLKEFLDFFETMTRWSERIKKMPIDNIISLVKFEQKLVSKE